MSLFLTTVQRFRSAVGLWVFAGALAFSQSAPAQSLCEAVFRSSERRISFGNKVAWEMIDLIDSAQTSLLIELSNVPDGRMVKALKRRVALGVAVQVNLDARPLRKSPAAREKFLAQIAELREAGIDVDVAIPEKIEAMSDYPRAVLHRKFIVADSKRYYVGSANLGRHMNENIDIGFFGEGALIQDLRKIFFEDRRNYMSTTLGESLSALRFSESNAALELVGAGTPNPDTRSLLISQIHKARKRILISAFEASDRAILRALLEKQKSDPEIDIRVILPKMDLMTSYKGTDYSYQGSLRYKEAGLSGEISVHLLGNEEIANHSRLMVFDEVVYLGSADFTPRALDGSIELGLIAKDRVLANDAAGLFESFWKVSPELTTADMQLSKSGRFFTAMDRAAEFWAKTRGFLRRFKLAHGEAR